MVLQNLWFLKTRKEEAHFTWGRMDDHWVKDCLLSGASGPVGDLGV